MPQSSENPENLEGTPEENATGTDFPKVIGDPKNTVVNFLSNLNTEFKRQLTANQKTQVGDSMTAFC